MFILGDELTIKGASKEESTDGVVFHRRERCVGAFTRVIHLPVEVDADKVRATLRDGVLTLHPPKVEAVKPRKIEDHGKVSVAPHGAKCSPVITQGSRSRSVFGLARV